MILWLQEETGNRATLRQKSGSWLRFWSSPAGLNFISHLVVMTNIYIVMNRAAIWQLLNFAGRPEFVFESSWWVRESGGSWNILSKWGDGAHQFYTCAVCSCDVGRHWQWTQMEEYFTAEMLSRLWSGIHDLTSTRPPIWTFGSYY